MTYYHDYYLLCDVLLLAVFENFRNIIMNEHNVDCLHFVILPSLAWTSALQFTCIELDLITDPDAYLMRGGIVTISHRHAAVNNLHVEGYVPH